ncbi:MULTISPECIES: potassium-transporting ATPase subunit C [Actinoalloteichus]|uniref:Potassium-transporting ATPase KdpC subunit n=1 Tax=Actinoalloteichus fjordicus TaxID=1612552 RepID=A0AAC9PUI2_9PSEU|nr:MULTISPECIES: potassium-transporting ATPase subunit C [Actinoalloteichus]APU17120.1 K+-transporting ATPase, c chain [Actinoalloteichus fjordicus]APU23202.1 K+-transporting ATPase, c chain [Actinoalloteichus sp. GBA129-24]
MSTTLLRQTMAGLRLLLVMTVLTGIMYPITVYSVSRLPGLSSPAEGSVVYHDGRAVGLENLGLDLVDPAAEDDPTADRYFHHRPSAAASASDGLGPGDPAASGGSNLAGDNPALTRLVHARAEVIATREGVPIESVPPDAVTASASGLDPDISPAYAELQVARVARVTGLSEQRVRDLVDEHTQGRELGFLGGQTVNVLTLNVAVAEAISGESADDPG